MSMDTLIADTHEHKVGCSENCLATDQILEEKAE